MRTKTDGKKTTRVRGTQQQKRAVRCSVGDQRFTVVRIGGPGSGDTHAGRSFEQAFRSASPDRGNAVEVFAVCAKDAGAARLLYDNKPRQLLRRFRYKGGR
jgi:hypothetical protein